MTRILEDGIVNKFIRNQDIDPEANKNLIRLVNILKNITFPVIKFFFYSST